jgi:SAM-dependent methyltransferase
MTFATPFEAGADIYDAWYDSEFGAAVLRAEVDCLRPLLGRPGPGIEIGAGTGRFTEALALTCGVEPAPAMLAIAAQRGLATVRGVGEALPLRGGVAGTIVLVTTIEFVADAAQVCVEAARVLRLGGRLVVGFIPANGPWGERYRKAGEAGDPVFSAARFHTPADVTALAVAAGLAPAGARSTLLDEPSTLPTGAVAEGAVEWAGFCAMAFTRGGG